MDQEIPVGVMDGLCVPLIPGDVGIDLIEDVYTVGESSSERWRSYINCENWNPRQFHDDLLVMRAYHARMCWETCNFMAITESNWLCLGAISMIQETAHYELRRTEFKILSFQLTTGMLGLIANDKDILYRCSVILFTTMHWLTQKIFVAGEKDKTRRKQTVKLQTELRPYSVDGVKHLGLLIDKNIFALYKFMENENFEDLRQIAGAEFIKELGIKLRNCILILDKILTIT